MFIFRQNVLFLSLIPILLSCNKIYQRSEGCTSTLYRKVCKLRFGYDIVIDFPKQRITSESRIVEYVLKAPSAIGTGQTILTYDIITGFSTKLSDQFPDIKITSMGIKISVLTFRLEGYTMIVQDKYLLNDSLNVYYDRYEFQRNPEPVVSCTGGWTALYYRAECTVTYTDAVEVDISFSDQLDHTYDLKYTSTVHDADQYTNYYILEVASDLTLSEKYLYFTASDRMYVTDYDIYMGQTHAPYKAELEINGQTGTNVFLKSGFYKTKSSVVINCHVFSDSDQLEHWIVGPMERHLLGKQSQIRIQVTEKSIGNWYCQSWNSLGNVTSDTVSLNILRGVPHSTVLSLNGKTLKAGEEIIVKSIKMAMRINCSSYGYPDPTRYVLINLATGAKFFSPIGVFEYQQIEVVETLLCIPLNNEGAGQSFSFVMVDRGYEFSTGEYENLTYWELLGYGVSMGLNLICITYLLYFAWEKMKEKLISK